MHAFHRFSRKCQFKTILFPEWTNLKRVSDKNEHIIVRLTIQSECWNDFVSKVFYKLVFYE